jgi:hypothetical protein
MELSIFPIHRFLKLQKCRCSNFIYLDLGYSEFISDIALKAIAEHLHIIKYLCLKNCYRISQKTIDMMLFSDLEIGGYYTLPSVR